MDHGPRPGTPSRKDEDRVLGSMTAVMFLVKETRGSAGATLGALPLRGVGI